MPFFPSFGSSGCCCFPVGLVPLIIIGVIIYIVVQSQQKKNK
jgi:preprotein translocase subunit YajC